MFTGLIEAIAPVKSNIATSGGRVLCLPLGDLAEGVCVGESICVNGVCLTVSRLEGKLAWFDVMAETVRASTLVELKSGELVNLERALPAGGRLGGHIVQGHVDCVGTVDRIESGPAKYTMWVKAPPELMRFVIDKGSIAIDGISLTVVDVQPDRFSVSLIPTTLQDTNLAQRKKADKVNLEADLISKWINKRLDEILPAASSGQKLTREKLRELGFA